MSKVKVSDVAYINKSNFDFNNIDFVNYLDTGSITNNIIEQYQYLLIKDKIPSRAKRAVNNGTIVYSSVRPRLCHFGFLQDIPENTVVSTGFITLDAKPNINPYYLYNCLITQEKIEYIAKIADTSVSSYPSINPDDLGNMEIEIVDDYDEQCRIANIMQTIDKKIETNNKINAELESMAKTIYDYWFLQFEFPNEEGKPYKSSGGKMVWNEELKREIPEKWETTKLLNIISIVDNRGKNPPYSENKTNHPIIDVATLRDNGRAINYNECSKYVDEKTYNEWFRAGHPKKGDILFSTVGSLAETKIFYPDDKVKGSIAQNVIGLRTDKNLYSYIYEILVSEKQNIIGYQIGSVQPSLKVGHVLEHKIILPPQYILSKFASIIECINEKVNLCVKENQELASLRDFLLPMLMNGQIGFKDGER